jgi:hypothetical protein
MKHHDQPSPETVVCSDWRYVNELRVCQDILWEKGWKVRTIYVATAGVGPANDEELDSIAEIRASHLFDQEYIFRPSSRNAIMTEGRNLRGKDIVENIASDLETARKRRDEMLAAFDAGKPIPYINIR